MHLLILVLLLVAAGMGTAVSRLLVKAKAKARNCGFLSSGGCADSVFRLARSSYTFWPALVAHLWPALAGHMWLAGTVFLDDEVDRQRRMMKRAKLQFNLQSRDFIKV